eukprot:TRINITY_DN16859_c0_g1_i1.p1 TRINITY_DN16859_c0_g1~~TRINITY_DN16859_c0_g1_i1.p1  ORF type:complete len:618 (+),score=132.07 TRINITY_DN16859_c0_g1_i1:354-2207(+)
MLVEPHRNVLPPGWGPGVLVLEPTLPTDFVARRPPGWRKLDIDEIIKMASRDRDILHCEQVEAGPCYNLWTLMTPSRAKAVLNTKVEWSSLWDPLPPEAAEALSRTISRQKGEQSSEKVIESSPLMGRHANCHLIPVLTRDGRLLYAVAEVEGIITFWDVRQKREWETYNLVNSVTKGGGSGQGAVSALHRTAQFSIDALWRMLKITAVGPGRSPSQFVVAASSPNGVILRVFDELTIHQGMAVPLENIPWDTWPVFPDQTEEVTQTQKGKPYLKKPMVQIHAVFHIDATKVLATAESLGRPEVAMILDLECNTVDILDIYADGPPLPSAWQPEFDDADDGTFANAASEDGAPEEEVDEEEEIERDSLVMVKTVEKQKLQEIPGSRHTVLVCVWKSNRVCMLTTKDWQLYEQMLLDENATMKTRLDAPICGVATANQKEAALNLVISYTSMIIRWWQVSLGSCFQQACLVVNSPVTNLSLLTVPPAAQSAQVQVTTPPGERSTPRAGNRDMSSSAGRRGQKTSSAQVAAPQDDPPTGFFIGAADLTGAVLMLSGKGDNIKSIYTCADLSYEPDLMVDQLWCMETCIALQLRNGDVRHIEFQDFEDNLMQLSDIPGIR